MSEDLAFYLLSLLNAASILGRIGLVFLAGTLWSNQHAATRCNNDWHPRNLLDRDS